MTKKLDKVWDNNPRLFQAKALLCKVKISSIDLALNSHKASKSQEKEKESVVKKVLVGLMWWNQDLKNKIFLWAERQLMKLGLQTKFKFKKQSSSKKQAKIWISIS